MPDIFHYYGEDFVASPSGDLLVAGDDDTSDQRVYRRLLTNPIKRDASQAAIAPPDYTWHPTYGAGLPSKVGSPTDVPSTVALIRSQMAMEQSVQRLPAPTVSLTPFFNGLSSLIKYVNANTKTPRTLSFDVQN